MITSILPATSNKISWMGFFCSWLVVSIHIVHPDNGLSSYLDKLLAGSVARIAVPTFFCISGYLICSKLIQGGYWQELRKRFNSLLIPFYIWGIISLLSIIPIFVYQDYRANLPLGKAFINFIESKSILLLLSGFDLTQMPSCGPLWYIRNLIFLVILSPLLLWLVRKGGRLFVLLLFIILCVHAGISDKYPEKLYGFLTYGLSIDGMFSFSLGLMLHYYNSKLSSWHYIAVAIIMCLITFSLLGSEWGKFLKPIFILSASYTVWYFMPEKAIPKKLAQASFPIYVMHTIFIGYLQTFPGWIPGTQSVIGFLIHWLVPIILSIMVSVLMHHYLPRVSSFVFGGR